MGFRLITAFLCLVGCLPRPAWAQDSAVEKLLQPRTLTLKTDGMPLSKMRAELGGQTGNAVVDRRRDKTDPKLKLNLVNAAFWPALDTIAAEAKCGISVFQDDGQVALIDKPAGKLATCYQGMFRIEARRISIAQDGATGTHDCVVTLNIAWEPRFQPLYLAMGPVQATFAADKQGTELQARIAGDGNLNVAGRGAQEVDIRLPAPKRSAPAIKALEGKLQLTGPGKMLVFAFPNLAAAARQQSKDGVQVTIGRLKTTSRRWSVEVTIDNPSGNPPLESFQSWLGNNRISLTKGTGADAKIWRPTPNDELIEKESVSQARILYSFRLAPTDNPGSPADWTLHYRTPGPIGVISVPYSFKDLLLP